VPVWRVRATEVPGGRELDLGIGPDGRWAKEPAAGAELLPGRYALPGLVDAHCHLAIRAGDDGPEPAPLDAARQRLAEARAAGVTAVRDTGSPDSIVLDLLADGDGRLLACGRFLAPPGQYFPALHRPVPPGDLVAAALAEVAAGARWVKLVGDFPRVSADRDWGAAVPTYPLAEVAELVRAVHAAGARVAAHTATRHVAALVEVGVDSVEHGYAIDEVDLRAVAARGGAWTPTLCAALGTPREDPERRARQEETRERLRAMLPLAHRLGVTVMAGTDVVGTVAREVALLAELGLPPGAALAAASTGARAYLGLPDRPVAGAPADLVTYDSDPRADPAVLADPAAVVVAGRRVR
jgi:imidazolonepropionase-like amidohydrolase